MKNEIEEFCWFTFHNFLTKLNKYSLIEWKDVEQDKEPPDYFLWIDMVQYAVEVTSIFEEIKLGNHIVSDLTVSSSFRDFIADVESIAKERNIFKGAYVVSFFGSINGFGKLRKQISNNMLTYIENTKLHRDSLECVVFERGFEKIVIQKNHDRKDFIVINEDGSGKWEAESAEEICNLIGKSITNKSEKMNEITFPKILLLYDAYPFTEIQMYLTCINKISHLSDFHTVFLVQREKLGITLYSENPDWLR